MFVVFWNNIPFIEFFMLLLKTLLLVVFARFIAYEHSDMVLLYTVWEFELLLNEMQLLSSWM